jgi:hypothetical protein
LASREAFERERTRRHYTVVNTNLKSQGLLQGFRKVKLKLEDLLKDHNAVDEPIGYYKKYNSKDDYVWCV